ncbi:hypothetical protein SteCoe_18839 [Stentor coeruleus]|uniref:Uncharacterized protein n=1 Tax=Stentor coeruleus TaxID=5963 RepID=A0A1R2BVS7_9CILI|nr:hypothetical protein SteCoe_18839 [Stentor coeruleus]
MYECLATQILYSDGQSVPLSELKNKIKYPVIVYLNGESFLEAKIMQEDTTIKLNLDTFRVKQGKEDTMFISMNSDMHIAHNIISAFVFFKDTNENPTVEAIKHLLAEEVTVFIKDGKFRAEINSPPIFQDGKKTEKCESLLIQQEIKVHKDYYDTEDINLKSFTYNAKKDIHNLKKATEEIKNKADDEYFLTSKFENQSSITYNYRKNSYKTQDPSYIKHQKNIIVVYATRYIFTNFLGSSSSWFFKRNQGPSNDKWTIFIGLCEATFRFPQSNLRKILKYKLVQALKSFGQESYEASCEWLVAFGDKRDEGISLEDLHSYLNQSLEFFKYYANYLIGEINFEALAEEYRVCFNIYKGEASDPENQFYQPYTYECFYPVISLYHNDEYYLIYSDLVMKYDGFNLMTLRLDAQSDIIPDWPLIYVREVIPDSIKLLKCMVELQEYASCSGNYDKNNLKKTSIEFMEVLENLAYSLTPENLNVNNDYENYATLLNKIKSMKFEDLLAKPKCKCGENCEGELKCCKCGDLCNRCAICIEKTEYCLYCDTKTTIKRCSYMIECLRCKQIFDNTNMIGFYCRCVLCRNCIKAIFSLGKCLCERDFDNNDEFYVNEFLLS